MDVFWTNSREQPELHFSKAYSTVIPLNCGSAKDR